MNDCRRLEPGDLLTVRQALAIVPVGRSSLYELLKEGRLPAYRVQVAPGRRGRLLIHREDLEVFAESCRTGGHTAPKKARVDVDDVLSRVRGKG